MSGLENPTHSEEKSLNERLLIVETKQDMMMGILDKIANNEQRHTWALIIMLGGTLIPLVLKILNII